MYNKRTSRIRRHKRVRAKVSGNIDRPRLSIFRSLSQIYAQIIDDQNGKTLVAASSKEVKGKHAKSDVSAEVGKIVAEKAVRLGINKVTLDRGGYKYHGRIKSLAEAARAAGLEF